MVAHEFLEAHPPDCYRLRLLEAQGKCLETMTTASLTGLCSHLWRNGQAHPADAAGTRLAIARMLRAQAGRYTIHSNRGHSQRLCHYDSSLLAMLKDCFQTTIHWLQGPLTCLPSTACPQKGDADTLTSYA